MMTKLLPPPHTQAQALLDAHVEARRVLCLHARVRHLKVVARQQGREQAEGLKRGQRLAQARPRAGIERVPGPHADVEQRARLSVEEPLWPVVEAVVAPHLWQPVVDPVW